MNAKRTETAKEFTVIGEEPIVHKAPVAAKPSGVDIPISFDRWWLQTQSKYKFKPALKSAVKKHFEARGFMNYKKFNEGLRDFGFKT
jgi:hypothetical protein